MANTDSDSGKTKPVDVIAQFNRDGSIIPMKIRIVDEDGELQAYRIKCYKDLSNQRVRTLSEGIFGSNEALSFDCYIEAFGRKRLVRLYYNDRNMVWRITVDNH